MSKDFEQWHGIKKQLHHNERLLQFKQREIWWCSIGVNVGHEQDGKGKQYNRPVLVVKKFNRRLFWGVPLTTQIKDNPHYHKFSFRGKQQCALLTQMRLWDVGRITHKMGQLPHKEFNAIRDDLIKYLK